MVIIWGSRLYGKVDVVPGLFHVETKFGHLWYIPLIPFGSFLVLNKEGNAWNGVRIPMSFKSILLAWLRIGLLMGVFSNALLTVALSGVRDTWVVPAILCACFATAFALLKFHKFATRASYQRACQLGEIVGMSTEGRRRIDEIYGYQDGVLDPFAGMKTTT